MTLRLFELRNYTLQPAMTEQFIDYFEEHFLRAQQDHHMHIIGQFRVIGEPDHFVWLRGYTDMDTRLAGLKGFYGSAYWKQRRNATNAMLIDSSHVHLLRATAAHTDLTRGETLDSITAALTNSTIRLQTGVIAIDCFQADAAPVEQAAEHLQAAYAAAEIPVRGILTTETAHDAHYKDSILQVPGLLIVVSAYPDEAAYRQRSLPTVDQALVAPVEGSLALTPTLRSPLRW
jgi:hypothetical protein